MGVVRTLRRGERRQADRQADSTELTTHYKINRKVSTSGPIQMFRLHYIQFTRIQQGDILSLAGTLKQKPWVNASSLIIQSLETVVFYFQLYRLLLDISTAEEKRMILTGGTSIISHRW